MRFVSCLLAWTLFLVVTTALVVLGGCAQLLCLPWDPNRRVSAAANRVFWGYLIFWTSPMLSLRAEGVSKVGPGPYVVVANHRSFLDIPALMRLPLRVRVVARRGIFRVPVMGSYMRLSRQITLDRDSPEGVDRFVRECRRALAEGASVAVFPEGTRATGAELGRFHRGAFRLAKDANVPVLPVAVRGGEIALPKGRFWSKKALSPMHMRVLDPVSVQGFSTARALSRRVESVLREELSGPDPLLGEAS